MTDDRERHVCLGPYDFDDAGSRDDCLTSVIASTTDIPDFASTTEPTGPFRTYRSGKLVRVADCRSDACLHWLQTEAGLVWYLSRRSAEIPWPRMDEAVAQSFGLRLATDR